jgi:hypothetical protein
MAAYVLKLKHAGFTCQVWSDVIWHEVRDPYGEPCGTIARPHDGVNVWAAYTILGRRLTDDTCSGPSHALRSLAIYHGA